MARLPYYLNAIDHQPVPGPLSAVNSAALVQHCKSLMPTVPTVTRGGHPARSAQTLTPADTSAPAGLGPGDARALIPPRSIPKLRRRPADPGLLVARPDWQVPP